jgi:hypothetical protein
MENTRLIIRGRIEEVPTMGRFTLDLLGSLLDSFKAYKSVKYTDGYIMALEIKLAAVRSITNPVVLTSELKVITLRLMNNVIGLRLPMNLLEGYVVDATGLTVAPKDFGIKYVRKKVGSRDVEGLDGALSTVITNITNNMAALTAVGYTDAMKTALEKMKTDIANDNAEQNKKLKARANLVANNMGVINDFLRDIKSIWADGKRLFSLTDKAKAKLFSNADMIRRLRNDELHTLIVGTVENSSAGPANKVKVVARPSIEGKRGKTVRTNLEGFYEMKGLRPTSYIITFTMPDGKDYVVSADAKTNETVRVDFKEPAEV